VKQYIGAHLVNYSGKLSGKGVIRGSWEIPENCAGEFKIKMQFDRWRGFFVQGEDKSVMKLQMVVQPEGVFGIGTDEVGSFICRGDWFVETNQLRFIKQYIGQHSVIYDGVLTKHKRWEVEGFWAIPGNCDGKFQLKRAKGKDAHSSGEDDSGNEECEEVEIAI